MEDAEGLRCFSDGMEAFAVCGIDRCTDVVFLTAECLASKGKMKLLYASLSLVDECISETSGPRRSTSRNWTMTFETQVSLEQRILSPH